jgi:hypothetical protein
LRLNWIPSFFLFTVFIILLHCFDDIIG